MAATAARMYKIIEISNALNMDRARALAMISASGLPIHRMSPAPKSPYRLTLDQAVAIFGGTNPDGVRNVLLALQ